MTKQDAIKQIEKMGLKVTGWEYDRIAKTFEVTVSTDGSFGYTNSMGYFQTEATFGGFRSQMETVLGVATMAPEAFTEWAA